ncbi:MAG: hypothetical protein Q8M92_02560, partial [Candidatus Subteraquimicrobiales bacterium]|nr:hypothetical protein [Candidatus Subteraquimicrobiales bacterium]
PESSKPSANLRTGIPPVWMEKLEGYLSLRSSADSLVVYPLDGAGRRLRPLSKADVAKVADGFEIHIQKDTQDLSPWYELIISPSD